MSFAALHPFAVGKFGSHRLPWTISINTPPEPSRVGKAARTHDRVLHLKPEFKTQDCALMYAAAQGRNWLVNPASLA